jgi:hypothetical protein
MGSDQRSYQVTTADAICQVKPITHQAADADCGQA